MGQKRDFASAFKSTLVTVYVGPEKHKYTPHKDILTQSKYFAGCLESSFRESETNEMSLPEDEPEIFEKLLEYLYRGEIEVEMFRNFDVEEPEYIAREIATTLHLARVYIAADKYCMESCQNHIMDYFVAYCKKRTPSILIITELNKRRLRGCLLRKLLLLDVSSALVGRDESYMEAFKYDEDIAKTIEGGGKDAYDLLVACCRYVSERRDDQETNYGARCDWHVHKSTKKCETEETQ